MASGAHSIPGVGDFDKRITPRRMIVAVVVVAIAALVWLGRGNNTPFCEQHPEAAICTNAP